MGEENTVEVGCALGAPATAMPRIAAFWNTDGDAARSAVMSVEANIAPLPKVAAIADADAAEGATTVEDMIAVDVPVACRRRRPLTLELNTETEMEVALTLNCVASAALIADLDEGESSCATETPEKVTLTLSETGVASGAEAVGAVELELRVTVTFCTEPASMPNAFGTAQAIAVMPTLEKAGMLDTKECNTADPNEAAPDCSVWPNMMAMPGFGIKILSATATDEPPCRRREAA